MPTPNVYFKIIIGFVLLLLSFCGGYYLEHLRFVDYQEKVIADGKVQGQHNKDLLKQQALISQKVDDEYKNNLDRINNYYAGQLRQSSSSKLPATRTTSIGIAPASTQPLLDCARTTEQLEALQDWVRQNTQAK